MPQNQSPRSVLLAEVAQATQRLADAGVPTLGRVPFDVQLSVSADQGIPLVLGNPRGPVALEFARIGAAVRRWLLGMRDEG